MDFLNQYALYLLVDVSGDVCVFCRKSINDDQKAQGSDFEVSGKVFSCCKGCVENATDLRGRDLVADDIRDEFVQSQTLTCYVCGKPGATVICPNVMDCGSKFHWPCRRGEGDSGSDCSKCSRCSTFTGKDSP